MQTINSVTLDKNAMNTCRLSAPYPSVEHLGADSFSAKLLLSNYAGCVSELSSITQYIFHRLSVAECAPDVAELLRCIGMVEMHHMNLLGSAIVKLGGSPVYCEAAGNRCMAWTPKYVNYQTQTQAILAANIKQEEQSIAKYCHTLSLLSCPILRALLDRIMQDEQLHLQALRKISAY